ncbi:MAG: SDR family NAD(P)-dependent oxidoreductase, partial [Actinobacteria bacterium]|nr:SDR family oxidoreductase [Actinomycetota bacterium]NIS29259.1 SDR family oxidoreductase [Actinomycetota bacterium]NIU64651.1 SDR family oxidoreductase [Actinomycetota bacterium]NIW26443.1 SDR family NAD(P)-dependent oxidoreductase [Actinomycetota bacterium]NIX19010.1 SDR family NAD(P)-dependent oxidoreductase [Actinomycetota bacterium]
MLVVGATGALGSRIAARLHDRGALLTLTGRDEQRLAGLGLPGRLVRADLRVAGDCRRMVADAIDEHRRLDGVVNAAGVVAFGGLADLEDATLDDLFATDVVGPLRVAREALGHLGEGSFIAQISGVVAEHPVAGMAAYSAAKAALASAMAALAREVRRQGVTVIDVQPPHTETGLASRPIAGTAPRFPEGLDPDRVADRIVAAIE